MTRRVGYCEGCKNRIKLINGFCARCTNKYGYSKDVYGRTYNKNKSILSEEEKLKIRAEKYKKGELGKDMSSPQLNATVSTDNMSNLNFDKKPEEVQRQYTSSGKIPTELNSDLWEIVAREKIEELKRKAGVKNVSSLVPC